MSYRGSSTRRTSIQSIDGDVTTRLTRERSGVDSICGGGYPDGTKGDKRVSDITPRDYDVLRGEGKRGGQEKKTGGDGYCLRRPSFSSERIIV